MSGQEDAGAMNMTAPGENRLHNCTFVLVSIRLRIRSTVSVFQVFIPTVPYQQYSHKIRLSVIGDWRKKD